MNLPVTRLANARIYTPFECIYPGSVEIEHGVINRVYKGLIKGAEDLKGQMVTPGFIDIHTHGAYGFDIASNLKGQDIFKSVNGWAKEILKNGVTAFLPTTITTSHDVLLYVCQAVSTAIKAQEKVGAKILGLHLEGPYINKEQCGAQNAAFIKKPDLAEFMRYWEASDSSIRTISIAPELEGALDFIKDVSLLGVKVSLGHSFATYKEAKNAIYAGASRATHIYNAMRPIHHREPGIAVACLDSPQVHIELIADLVHVSEAILRLTIQLAGVQRVVVVTDSIGATGLMDGSYKLGSLGVVVEDGVCRLENGGLAGSTLTMNKALKNLLKLGVSLNDALAMMTINPARCLGLKNLGAIVPGYSADLLVLDEHLNVKRVYVSGMEVYKKWP